MDEFKLLSIDELDAEFVSKLRVSKKSNNTNTDESLIPKFIKQEDEIFSDSSKNVADESINIVIDTDFTDSSSEATVYNPKFTEETLPRPIIPIGQTPSPYYPVGAPTNIETKIISEDDFDNENTKEKKSGKGYLAGKIMSITMLCVTVVVFLLGCFVSIFLNNKSVVLGKYCFNTPVREVTIGDDVVKERDLVISKKVSGNEYKKSVNSPIAVDIGSVESKGCDIHYIYAVTPLIEDEVTIQTYDPITSEIYSEKIIADKTYGIVKYFVPFAGAILLFAIDNAILICALFVLLAAFWCLLLILIEKNSKKAKNKE